MYYIIKCVLYDTTPSPDQLDKQVTNEHFPGVGGGVPYTVVQGQFVNAHRMAGDCEDGNTTPSPDQLDKQVTNEHFPGVGEGSYFLSWYRGSLSMHIVWLGTVKTRIPRPRPTSWINRYIMNTSRGRGGVLLYAVVQGQFVNEHRMAGDCEDEDTTPSPDQLDKQVKNEYFPG